MNVLMDSKFNICRNEPARIGRLDEADNCFWYWYGLSGRRYIHNVYDIDLCPPLPGAVYLAVRKCDEKVSDVIDCGLLPDVPGMAMRELFRAVKAAGATHIHAHLLASSPAEAQAICDDIRKLLAGISQLAGGYHVQGLCDIAAQTATIANALCKTRKNRTRLAHEEYSC